MEHERPEPPSFWRSPSGVVLCIALTVMGFYLVTEHTAHFFGVLPYLLILACPLMHLFMHHGHHHGHHHGGHVRLAISEERDSEKAFGDDWRTYAAATPRFIPRLLKHDDARPASIH